jgi:hypothetical protein
MAINKLFKLNEIILKAFQNHMSTVEVSNRRSETIQGLIINDFARYPHYNYNNQNIDICY